MANYPSELTGDQIESALNAVSGLIGQQHNGKIIVVENGHLAAKSAIEIQGGTIDPITITSNGVYTHDQLGGYSPVTVNVSGGGGIPESISITRNGTYTRADGGYSPVNVNVPLPSHGMVIFDGGQTNSNAMSNGKIVRNSYYNLIVPKSGTPFNISKVDIDYSQPFEIGTVIEIGKSVNHANCLFGECYGYWHIPTIELHTDGYIWCGASSNGSSWNYSVNLYYGTYNIGDRFFIYLKYDGSKFEAGFTKDYENYTKQSISATSMQSGSSYEINFGDINKGSSIKMDCASMNLYGTYLKQGDTVVWGSTYLEDNQLFDLSA